MVCLVALALLMGLVYLSRYTALDIFSNSSQ